MTTSKTLVALLAVASMIAPTMSFGAVKPKAARAASAEFASTAPPAEGDPDTPRGWSNAVRETYGFRSIEDFTPGNQVQRARFLAAYLQGVSHAGISPDAWGYFAALDDCNNVISIVDSRKDEFHPGGLATEITSRVEQGFDSRFAPGSRGIELTVSAQLEPWDRGRGGFLVNRFDKHVSVGHKSVPGSAAIGLYTDGDGAALFIPEDQMFVACKRPNGRYVAQEAFPSGSDTLYSRNSVWLFSGRLLGFFLTVPTLFIPADEAAAREIVNRSPDRLVDVHLFISPTGPIRIDSSTRHQNFGGGWSKVTQMSYRNANLLSVTASDAGGTPLTAQPMAPGPRRAVQDPSNCGYFAKLLDGCGKN